MKMRTVTGSCRIARDRKRQPVLGRFSPRCARVSKARTKSPICGEQVALSFVAHRLADAWLPKDAQRTPSTSRSRRHGRYFADEPVELPDHLDQRVEQGVRL